MSRTPTPPIRHRGGTTLHQTSHLSIILPNRSYSTIMTSGNQLSVAQEHKELEKEFDFARMKHQLRHKPFDTDDLYDRVVHSLECCGVDSLAWEVDCDEANKFLQAHRIQDLENVRKESDVGDVTKYATQRFGHFKLLPMVQRAISESQTYDELSVGLISAYKICYANVFMPEKVVENAPEDIARKLELYVYTFGLTDFLQRVKEERDRERHQEAMDRLEEIHEIQLAGSQCMNEYEIVQYMKRVKPAMKYLAKYYRATPLGDGFNACVVRSAMEAVERKVPQLRMPHKLSEAYNRAIGGEVIGDDDTMRTLAEVSQYMNQNELLFRGGEERAFRNGS